MQTINPKFKQRNSNNEIQTLKCKHQIQISKIHSNYNNKAKTCTNNFNAKSSYGKIGKIRLYLQSNHDAKNSYQ